jgi:zinc-binding alcohol dehydrogenase family protein
MAVQLARRLTGLAVIGTASRPESRRWVQEMGAHHVLDHSTPLQSQLERLGRKHVRYILSLTHTDAHWQEIVDVLAPQGEVCVIDDPVDIKPLQLKAKAASLHVELMFVRSTFQTPDMIAQHRLLNEVAALIDEGLLKTTLNRVLEPINAATLREAHRAIESGQSIGKIVVVRA